MKRFQLYSVVLKQSPEHLQGQYTFWVMIMAHLWYDNEFNLGISHYVSIQSSIQNQGMDQMLACKCSLWMDLALFNFSNGFKVILIIEIERHLWN